MMIVDEQKQIRLDRMRFTKNALGSRLVYLAILLNILYFVSIYESDVGTWYYRALIGISIVYNLMFMLVSFLASEGVKNYKLSYGYVLLGLGAGQIARIFILPILANQSMTKRNDILLKKVIEIPVMQSPQFISVIVFLCLSALCCIAAGLISIKRSKKLAAYHALLENAA